MKVCQLCTRTCTHRTIPPGVPVSPLAGSLSQTRRLWEVQEQRVAQVSPNIYSNFVFNRDLYRVLELRAVLKQPAILKLK